MKSTLKKAVIPAAGLGTRFLPATKTIPKEMLSIVDKPILLYVVEEAIRAGIEDIVLVQGRGKSAIEDFFDTSFELEATLERTGKQEILSSIRKLKDMANIISVRQKVPLGLGHAVLTARSVVGDEPFALLLGDEIMINAENERTAIGQIKDLYERHQKSVVAVMEVSTSDVSKYGIISGKQEASGLWRVDKLVEKPSPEEAPSRLAMPGRYVLSPKIFEYLSMSKPGKNGEIQLTDSLQELARNEGLLATTVKSRRYDAGDRLGYLQANIELALERPDLRAELIPYLRELNSRMQN